MHSNSPKALVLAAGAGTRLDPLTRTVPKPLVPVCNRPVLEHVLRLLKHHRISEVAANLHYLSEQILTYVSRMPDLDLKMHFVKEDVLSGDAGGMRACRQFLQGGTFVVIMGDLITDIDLSFLINRHRRSGAVATIALKPVEDVQYFGVARLGKNSQIEEFQEKPKPEEAISNLASTGIYVFEPQIFDYVPRNGDYLFGNQLFPKLLRMGVPINGVRVLGHWSDIGSIDAYKLASFDCVNGLINVDLPTNHYNPDHDRHLHVNGSLFLGADCQLSAGTKINGRVVIGDNCIIGPGVELEDTIIWNGTTVSADSVLKDTIVGSHCTVPAGTYHEGETIIDAPAADADLPSKLARLRQMHADSDGFLSNSRRLHRSA